MSSYIELTFDPQPGRDYTPAGAIDGTIPTHAHTVPVCVFCQTRTGAAAGAAGAAAVTRDPEWHARAAEWLSYWPVGDVFTADDLTDAVGLPVGSANQVGALIRTWSQRAWIRHTGYVKSTRASNHGRVVATWAVA